MRWKPVLLKYTQNLTQTPAIVFPATFFWLFYGFRSYIEVFYNTFGICSCCVRYTEFHSSARRYPVIPTLCTGESFLSLCALTFFFSFSYAIVLLFLGDGCTLQTQGGLGLTV